jgi:uncharacterized membrane protein
MSTAKAKSTKPALTTTSMQIDWWRTASIVLCIVGAIIAGYMVWAEVTGNETACADTGKIDCSAVQQSAYAKTLGFPVALMGLLGYLAILGVLVLEDQVELLAAYGRTLIVGMTLFGVIFQVYLTVIEGTVLDAWCQWCVASFVIITVLLILASYRMFFFLKPLQR